MKTILLIGAGKSATVLIDYLIETVKENKWKCIVADANVDQILAKTGGSPYVEAVALDVTNENQRSRLIERAHVVISMMPPALHFLIAKDCVEYRKHLLTASYVDNAIRSLNDELKHKKLLFLCEMGLDPGIDHMSAMQLFDQIHAEGGTVTSFKSHCGGLVAPESDNNPWHYKISWNPRNVVLAGKAGAVYKQNNQLVQDAYQQLFKDCKTVTVEGLQPLAYYPNRDSLSYVPVYKLEKATTFIRTTLRYPAFCKGWQAIVDANLADDTTPLIPGLSFKEWSASVLPFINDDNKYLLEFLGLFDESPVPVTAQTSADVLQHLLETKWAMQSGDKDMIVMLHEIAYEKNGQAHQVESSLVVKGDDHLRTAMAKTVGLPLGIAAKMILNGELNLTGVQIPIHKSIYEPVLNELKKMGIAFHEKHATA